MASAKQYKQIGEEIWKTRTEKINAELFTMAYGALVIQLIQDYEDYAEVNKQLEKMGYNIGTRLIEDFLARSGLGRCSDFKEVGEVVAKVGFKTFLNITPSISHLSAPGSSTASTPQRSSNPPALVTGPGSAFVLTLEENPLAEFVELPEEAHEGGLWYSNVLCGVLRGALEMINLFTNFFSDIIIIPRGPYLTVEKSRFISILALVQMQVEVIFLNDQLRGDEATEMKVTLVKYIEEEVPMNDE